MARIRLAALAAACTALTACGGGHTAPSSATSTPTAVDAGIEAPASTSAPTPPATTVVSGHRSPTPGSPSPAASPAPAPTPAARPTGRWTVGIYASYQRDLMPPSEIDWTAMTHLEVTRVVPKPDGTLDTTFDVDDTNGPALARQLSGLAVAHHVVPILMVGGGGTHDDFASAAQAHSATLVRNLVAAMHAYGFAGLDLDFEPINDADQPTVLALVTALRRAAPGALLTVPVGSLYGTHPSAPAFYARLAASVDQVNDMTYAMAGDWSGWKTWFSSALHGATDDMPAAVDGNVDAFLAAGVPARKLGLGVGFFGTCWAGGVNGPRQPLGQSHIVAQDNDMSYTAIMRDYFTPSAYRYDLPAQAPYLGFGAPHGPKGCTFVSYEDARSIAAKGAYAQSRGLGGAIVWTINQAHVPGGGDPLLRATRTAFGA